MRVVRNLLYEQTSLLAAAIANATIEDDEISRNRYLGDLASLYQAYLTEPDPFLTETFADFTESDHEAIRLYTLAIEQARSFSGEPFGTKYLSRARRMLALGNLELAYEDLANAMNFGISEQDTYTTREAWSLKNRVQT